MFNAPNIKGPRFRKEYKAILSHDLFDKFVKTHPQYSTLSFEDFKKIIKITSQTTWETIIKERDGVVLPTGATIFIGSTKIRKKNNYDIQASIKANAPIKHRNYETDGFSAKILYSPHLSKISGRDRSIWSFKGCRTFKRTVAKEYPKDWKKYIIAADMYSIVKNYRRNLIRNYHTASIESAVKNYNEFDLN